MRRLKGVPFTVARFALLAVFLLFAVFPLYWIMITSLKQPREIYSSPLSYFPRQPTVASYLKLLSTSMFGLYFLNSLLVTVCTAIGVLVVGTLGGFALSRHKSGHFRNTILLTIYFTQMIPALVIMTPLYLMLSRLGMVNRLWSLIIIYVAVSVSFALIMSKSFFDRIPSSFEEAAMIDGCNIIGALWRVIVPVSLPGMAAIFIFTFINIWNELFLAVMFLSSPSKTTVQIALNSFITKAGVSWDLMSAGLVIALLPTVFVFGFAQKFIVAGLTEGSLKE